MASEFLLLVPLFFSLSMSYDNGLQLWKDCPSTQSIRGSKGSWFEITIQTFKNECQTLLSQSDIEEATKKIHNRRNGPNMQLTLNKERANITWNVQYESQCDRHIYMLDIEYLIENSQRDGASAYHWCFQYNVSKVENKQQKERVGLYFDCIHTVPDKEAYLVNIKLWSFQQNWSLSSRSHRSVKSNCGRIQCTTSRKEFLSIGPIKPMDNIDDKERIKGCQCWSNSTISLQTTNTKDRHLSIVVDNPNPYATYIRANVIKEEDNTFRVFRVPSVVTAENVSTFLTDINCEKDKGTYTPVLGYNCRDREYSMNSQCQQEDVEGPSITCPDPMMKQVPPLVDNPLPHITIVIIVLTGVIVAVAVTVIVFVCKHKENNEDVQRQLLRLPNSGSRQIMFLDHTDSSTTPLRKDCVNLISELLQTVGIELLGWDRNELFKNWIEVAERASKNDITEVLIIISRELISCQNSYMKPQNNRETISMESQNNTDYFSGSVLQILKARYILPRRVPFRIHILCLEHSDSELCETFIDTYSTFMIVKGNRKNTFLYDFAKCLQHPNHFIFDENVMPHLLKRLIGPTTLPENTKTYATKLKEKFSELYEDSTPALTGERTDTDINCVIEDLKQTLYSSETNVQSGSSSNNRNHKNRSEKLPFLRSMSSKAITKCSQKRRKVSRSGDEIELQMV